MTAKKMSPEEEEQLVRDKELSRMIITIIRRRVDKSIAERCMWGAVITAAVSDAVFRQCENARSFLLSGETKVNEYAGIEARFVKSLLVTAEFGWVRT